MVYPPRQLPSPSAAAWSFDLAAACGPLFVILATGEMAARRVLAEHLVELGQAEDAASADILISHTSARSVSVLW